MTIIAQSRRQGIEHNDNGAKFLYNIESKLTHTRLLEVLILTTTKKTKL